MYKSAFLPVLPWCGSASAGTCWSRAGDRTSQNSPRACPSRPLREEHATNWIARGGKTVLLNEIDRLAVEFDYSTIVVEAHEGKGLGDLLAPQFRKLSFELDRKARMNAAVKRGLAVLRAFIGSIKILRRTTI